MTLIHSNNGRCDSKCYGAEHSECDCICGGRNHGKGLKRATENTREMAERMIKVWKLKHPDVQIEMTVNQVELF